LKDITESGTGFPDGCLTGMVAFTGVFLCVFSNADNLGTNASPKNASFSCICYVTLYVPKKLARLAQKLGFSLARWLWLSAFAVGDKIAQGNLHGDRALANSFIVYVHASS
jgi:hypothetical protein